MAITKKLSPQAVNFGDPHGDLYMQSFDLPEGNYIWTELNVVNHKGFGTPKPEAPARLGVMITLVPREDTSVEPKQIFVSMGSSAHLAFAPDPNTGKGIVPIPGGSGQLPGTTNWVMLVESLMNSGMPKGVFTNDLSVLEGLHCHMQCVPEPKERSNFAKTKTGEAPEEERKARNVPVVTEIFDDGKPWEGSGGIPEGGKKTVTKKAAAAPAPVEEEETETASELDADDIKIAAQGALASILEKNPKGMAKSGLKLAAGKEVKKTSGDDMFQAVAAAWDKDTTLAQWVEELDFIVAGPMIKPKP